MTSNSDVHLPDAVLNEYLDGALDRAAQLAADAHLAGCPACTLRLNHMRLLFASLERLPDEPLQRDLSRGVAMALRRTLPVAQIVPRPPRWAARVLMALQTSVAALLLVFAWPLVQALAARLQLQPVPGQVPLLSGVAAAYAGASAFLANPQGTLGVLRDWLATSPAAQLIALAGWLKPAWVALALAVAATVWLLGNALLLAPPLRARLRRQP